MQGIHSTDWLPMLPSKDSLVSYTHAGATVLKSGWLPLTPARTRVRSPQHQCATGLVPHNTSTHSSDPQFAGGGRRCCRGEWKAVWVRDRLWEGHDESCSTTTSDALVKSILIMFFTPSLHPPSPPLTWAVLLISLYDTQVVCDIFFFAPSSMTCSLC